MSTDKTPFQLWVEALRSGEYQQCSGKLSDGESYCCLGVLCEVYQQHVGGLQITHDEDVVYYNGHTQVLPSPVQKWAGLCHENSRFGTYGRSHLTVLNDRNTSFSDIADIIESRPPGLFVESNQ